MKRSFRTVIAAFTFAIGMEAVHADTVHMKDGGFIYDCRVLSEEEGTVHLRTPGGKMGVPREKIERIEKRPSVFDDYDARLARVRKGDAAGLFQLALWCRKTAGLRQEMGDLLEKVIEIRADHGDARRLLGHALVGGSWREMPAIDIRPESDDPELQEELIAQLSILFETRKDVRISDGRARTKKVSAEVCEVVATVATSGKGRVTFYGQTTRGAQTGSKVTLKARATWIRSSPEVEVTGEVGAGAGTKRIAFIDAINRNAVEVHDFFDRLVAMRVAAVEAAAAGDGPLGKEAGGSKGAAKKATKKR